ncbi:hypothetical protein BJV82DRAFT_476168, partial [Fennellomyces sp. T-0311]
QATRCLRRFIDFFHTATLKEHSSDTLRQLDLALKEYNELSPVFQSYSASKLRFPKNHMMWKYEGDIRRFGSVSGYSTCQPEHQHRVDAKTPGKRTN